MTQLVTTGCSFTGGVIPLPHLPKSEWNVRGSVWPHFVYSDNSNFDSLTNLGIPGGGNVASMYNLIYFLEQNNNKDTIVIFNITGLSRNDTICDSINPDANKDLCCVDATGLKHFSDTFGFGWITRGNGMFQKQNVFSELSIIQAISYLELNNYDYYFMFMNNSVLEKSNEIFKKFIKCRKDRLITFNSNSMYEFCVSIGETTDDGHPTAQGHKQMAKHIMEFLNAKA